MELRFENEQSNKDVPRLKVSYLYHRHHVYSWIYMEIMWEEGGNFNLNFILNLKY